MVAARLQRGLDAGQAEVDERPDGVADDLRAGEGLGERFDVVRRLDDFVGRRFQPHDALRHHLLRALGAARHRGEGDVLVDQPVHDQHAGVAAGAIDDDGVLRHVFESLFGWKVRYAEAVTAGDRGRP